MFLSGPYMIQMDFLKVVCISSYLLDHVCLSNLVSCMLQAAALTGSQSPTATLSGLAHVEGGTGTWGHPSILQHKPCAIKVEHTVVCK